jgi:uncharacterized membrane protein
MFGLPPLPGWEGFHPLIVHFPIALLLVTPLLVVLGLFLPRSERGFLTAAFVVMALGTLAIYVAVPSGEAAGKLAERTPEINKILERHEGLAETSRAVFTALTAIFAVIVFVPRLLRKGLDRLTWIALNASFLVLYGSGTLVLVNTAHAGGRLVHEQGVHAMTASPPEGSSLEGAAQPGEGRERG